MKFQLILFFNLTFSGFLWAQAPSGGLVAYYPFNGGGADESGNGHTGFWNGPVGLTTDRFGIANKAISLGGNANINVTNWSILSGNSPRTISVWFKTNIPSSSQYMVSWGGGSSTANASSYVGTYIGTNNVRYLGFFGIANDLNIINAFQYYDSQWHLMTFTYDGTLMSLYFDGILRNTTTNGPLNTGVSNLVIGSYHQNFNYFIGQLDDIRIYNRGLSASEVELLFQAEAPPPPSAEFAKIGPNRFIHTIGLYNTSVGNMAGNAISTGTNNTFAGYQTGRDNSSGSFNTFMGYRAGYLFTTGSNNVFLGANANPVGINAPSIQNSVALGVNAKVAISDAIVLGDTVNTNIKVGIGTAAPRFPLDVKGSINLRNKGQLRFTSRAFLQGDEQDYIVINGGKPGSSGLRIAQLTNQSIPISVTDKALSIDETGRIGLYRISADQINLQVTSTNQWADYVFSSTYKLLPINQLQRYIKKHQHLPNLPSAQEMVSKGASMEELIKGVIKTQEEQARYLLELQQENQRLRALVERLLKKNE